jgi:hypothetical protein
MAESAKTLGKMPSLHGVDRTEFAAWRLWRNRIPFTDAEVGQELIRHGETHPHPGIRRYWIRYGRKLRLSQCRLSKKAYEAAVPGLVKQCRICGERALYRWGAEGRCKLHREVKPEWDAAYMRRQERKAVAIAAFKRSRDAHLRGVDSAKTQHKAMGSRRFK